MADLKSLVEEAATAAGYAPEELREAAFKAVLDHLLLVNMKSLTRTTAERSKESSGGGGFLAEKGILEEIWFRVFDKEDGEILIPKNKFPGKAAAEKQVNMALLRAIGHWKENGAITAFPSNDLAELCREYGCHDHNLSSNLQRSAFFKKQRNSNTFKLTPDGETAAIRLVMQLGGGGTDE